MHQIQSGILVDRVMDGDLEAYGELVSLYQAEVWKCVSAILPEGDRTEDLVQEAFIRAYHQLHRFEHGRDFGVWLKAIARNLARNQLRHHYRELHRLLHYQASLDELIADNGAGEPDNSALKTALEHCLKLLPRPTAEVVALRYDQGLDFTAIARRLRRTVPAVRQLLWRARLWLKDCVERELPRS